MFRITANYWKLEEFMKTLKGGIRRRWYTSDKQLPANKSDYYSYTAKSYEWRLNLWLILQEMKKGKCLGPKDSKKNKKLIWWGFRWKSKKILWAWVTRKALDFYCFQLPLDDRFWRLFCFHPASRFFDTFVGILRLPSYKLPLIYLIITFPCFPFCLAFVSSNSLFNILIRLLQDSRWFPAVLSNL